MMPLGRRRATIYKNRGAELGALRNYDLEGLDESVLSVRRVHERLVQLGNFEGPTLSIHRESFSSRPWEDNELNE